MWSKKKVLGVTPRPPRVTLSPFFTVFFIAGLPLDPIFTDENTMEHCGNYKKSKKKESTKIFLSFPAKFFLDVLDENLT